MALVTVLTTDGRPVVAHSSIFDGIAGRRLPPRPGTRGAWPDVWRRWDARTRQQENRDG